MKSLPAQRSADVPAGRCGGARMYHALRRLPMRSVIQTAVRRTVTVCMVVVIVFAAGILAAQSTPVSLLPDQL